MGDSKEPEPPPEIESLNALLSELGEETDRGACLVGASYIDEELEEIISAFTIDRIDPEELFGGPAAPISTFSSKSLVAYSLGLITETEYSEITLIRRIRNEFAHSWEDIDFETESISNRVDNLPWRGPEDDDSRHDPRQRFTMAVAMLLGDLLWRRRLVEKEKRYHKEWPHRAGTISHYD